MLARGVQQTPTQEVCDGFSMVPAMATQSERTMAIADIIERYVTEHPHAADTPEGIRAWWVGRERYGDSLDDVQAALDYLLGDGRIARTVLPDGATIYGRIVSPRTSGNGKNDAFE
jgi:hypothetical protein